MELLPEILKFGAGGLIGAVFFWLYIQERGDHAKTRQELKEAMNDRLTDSKESVIKVTDALGGLALGVQAISDKIRVSRSET